MRIGRAGQGCPDEGVCAPASAAEPTMATMATMATAMAHEASAVIGHGCDFPAFIANSLGCFLNVSRDDLGADHTARPPGLISWSPVTTIPAPRSPRCF